MTKDEIRMILNLIYVLKSNIEVRKVHNTDWLFINNVQTVLLTQKQVDLINKLKERRLEDEIKISSESTW